MGNDYVTDSQLKAIMPTLSAAKRTIYLPHLNVSMARFDINTELRVSMYLAQLAHESGNLTRWVENLNYSAKRLTQVWRSRFPTLTSAQPFANNPKALANKVYNGRMGNRVNSDDGWNYRGRAPLQATGRQMYQAITDALGDELGVDFVEKPDLLLDPAYGFLASAWIFAVEKRCLPHADKRNIRACTKAINGGYNGLSDRIHIWERALAVLPDDFRLKSYEEFDAETKHLPLPEPVQEIPDVETDAETPDIIVKELSGVPDNLKETESGSATNATSSDGSLSPQIVVKEKPSLFSRVMTGIIAAIGTAIASVTATCGGNEVIGLIAKQGAERAVENATRDDLTTLGLVVAYIAIGLTAAVVLFWVASKWYEKSAERSNRLNQQKMTEAADKDRNTVELSK